VHLNPPRGCSALNVAVLRLLPKELATFWTVTYANVIFCLLFYGNKREEIYRWENLMAKREIWAGNEDAVRAIIL